MKPEAKRLERQPIWVREWIESLRQQAIKKRQRFFRVRVAVKRPSPEQILRLPFWIQDLIDDLEAELLEE